MKNEDADELPHNLGRIPELDQSDPKSEDPPAKKPKKSRVSSSKAQTNKVQPKKEDVEDLAVKAATTPKSSKKAKNNTYGVTPGQTPYPNWPHPTPEECEEVKRVLSKEHGEVKQPKTIPLPSLTVSGCGEVPSVLDALIRTLLSANTTNTNSSRAFAGLVAKFGVLQEGIGKGSVDWNKVRLADDQDVFQAIERGGLAKVKTKYIKSILQMVWEENQARREAHISSDNAPGSKNQSSEEKNAEVEKAEENVLTLDYVHALSKDEAFNSLIKYPGIGAKTASCVLLFCLQRPAFAVDTHVFRLSKWLGWLPPPGDPAGLTPGSKSTNFSGPTRDSTYGHLDVRIPDHLKYPLHTLLIKHGKQCPRCRAITGENSEGWDDGCVIEHLVQRTGDRKGGGISPMKNGKGRKSKAKVTDDETDLDSSELSDLGSEDEASEYSSE